MIRLCLASIILLRARSQAQLTPIEPQTDTWNSSFALSDADLAGVNISDTQTGNIEVAINFERSNWATGSVATDDFYSASSNSSDLPAGSLIKVEAFVNTTTYTLAPNTALSRILYTTRNLLNESVPASAFVLWPYLPAQHANLTSPNPDVNSSRLPVVGWAHGTSGIFAECGPSHIRNLWYQYSAPFEVALSGYVVVAPDYQGLGVNTTANGTAIVHPYLASDAAANDLFYAVQAAQEAFASLLSQEFVIMGHSQGGAAAWAAAERQVLEPVPGYRGTISASPPTNLSGLLLTLGTQVPPLLPFLAAEAVKAEFPSLNESLILTDEGSARLRLARDTSMCNSGLAALLSDFPGPDLNGTLLQSTWSDTPEIQTYLSTHDIGSRPIAGPMLVLQGTADPAVPYQFTDIAVQETCAVNNGSGIHYARFDQVSHVPVLYAARQIWLDFLRERFESVSAGAGADESASGGGSGSAACSTTNYTSGPMPVQNYQRELGYFLSLATQAYQVA